MSQQGPASGAGVLVRGLIAFLVTVAPVVMFLGFTLGTFSFPTHPLKALATVFLTPALLATTAVVLGWGPWLFFADECFAEIGGMGIGAALAAVVHGAGGAAVRGCGALVFFGSSVAAGYFYGSPMFATRRIDAVWIALNLLALAWTSYVYFRVFAFHGLRKQRTEGTLSPAGQAKLTAMAGEDGNAVLTLGGGAQKAAIVVGLAAWLLAIPASAVVSGAGAEAENGAGKDKPTKDGGRRGKGKRRRPRRR